jgi:hypothetical protein
MMVDDAEESQLKDPIDVLEPYTSQLRTRYGPVSCFTPLGTRSLDHARGRPYRGPGRLPGPDLPWLAISSCTRSTHVIWISSFCHGARADGHTP